MKARMKAWIAAPSKLTFGPCLLRGSSEAGQTLILALASLSLTVITAVGTSRVMSLNAAATLRSTHRGTVNDLRNYLRTALDCRATRSASPTCDGAALIDIFDRNGQKIIASNGRTVFGKHRLQATCDATTNDISVRYLRVQDATGAKADDDPIKRAGGNHSASAKYTWQDLFDGIPIACAAGCAAGGGGHCIFVADVPDYEKLPPGPEGSRDMYSQICQQRADTNGLGGTWRALLSLTTDWPIAAADMASQAAGEMNARDYIPIHGPVYNTMDELVADGPADFWSDVHKANAEFGADKASIVGNVMTGTRADGSYADRCHSNWGAQAWRSCNCKNYRAWDGGHTYRTAAGWSASVDELWIYQTVTSNEGSTICTFRTNTHHTHPNFMCVSL